MRLVESIREQFTGYLAGFNALQTTRTKLAPLFMRAFNAWAGDTGGSFVAFVRLYDPTVPLQSEGYRNHPTMNAAEYLRRKARDIHPLVTWALTVWHPYSTPGDSTVVRPCLTRESYSRC
jgi:hypothetical protein